MKTRAALAAALALAAIGVSPAYAETFEVAVGPGSIFAPQSLEIAVGDSVTWTVNEDGHTITANDGRFDADGLVEGGTFTFGPFDTDETVYYRCRVHAEMFGVITVGEGTPIPDPGSGPSEIRRVCRDVCDPGEYATVADAVATALPRALIELEPGAYTEPIVLAIPGVVVRGVGASPADVIIDANRTRLYGVELFGDETAIENVTIRRAGFAGVRATTADGFGVADVVAEDNGRAGVFVESARGGFVRDSVARAHILAGFAAADCPDCDTVFTRVLAEDNFIGFDADDAGGLVVSDSTFTGNGAGVVLRTTWTSGDQIDENAPQRGAHIIGNLIQDNTSLTVAGPPISAEAPWRSGSGVWINAGSFNVIEGNEIADHLYGVVITGLVGPSSANRIIGNTVGASSAADLAWDGIGAGTCFGDNQTASEALTTSPPEAQTLYGCDLPTTAGIPFPLVDAMLLDYATI